MADNENESRQLQYTPMKPEFIMLYLVALGSFALVECLIGFSLKNVHIVRDFITNSFTIMTLGLSLKAMQVANQRQSTNDKIFHYGHARFNLIAAFLNTSLILFNCIFGFLETIHHIIEHMDSNNHKKLEVEGEAGKTEIVNAIKQINQMHEDENHRAQISLYLTIFAILRLALFSHFLYFQNSHIEVQNYLKTNWLNWPNKEQKTAIKLKIKECTKWHSNRMNHLSINLVVFAGVLECFALLWKNLLCFNFVTIENLCQTASSIAILFLTIPLCIDLSYLLVQKITPSALTSIYEDKIRSIEYLEGVVCVKTWNCWCLDKSYRVFTMKVKIQESLSEDDIDLLTKQINSKLKGKWCEQLSIQTEQS